MPATGRLAGCGHPAYKRQGRLRGKMREAAERQEPRPPAERRDERSAPVVLHSPGSCPRGRAAADSTLSKVWDRRCSPRHCPPQTAATGFQPGEREVPGTFPVRSVGTSGVRLLSYTAQARARGVVPLLIPHFRHARNIDARGANVPPRPLPLASSLERERFLGPFPFLARRPHAQEDAQALEVTHPPRETKRSAMSLANGGEVSWTGPPGCLRVSVLAVSPVFVSTHSAW